MRILVRGAAALWALTLVSSCGGSSPSAPSPVSTSSSSTPTTTTTATQSGTPTVAYVNDVKAVLDANCIRCHGASARDGGVDLSTYAATMRVVSPGNASSPLVRATASTGSMYTHLSGDRAAKSALIRSWVVDNRAAETR